MEIWKSVVGAPARTVSGGAVVTIGVFDGVHRGHQRLMADVVRRARSQDLCPVAVTFDPHPLAVLAPDHAPAMLTSIERRVQLLHEHGIDEVRVLAFSPAMSRWTPEEFVDHVVVSQCGTVELVVGANFRFGAKAAGDVAGLESMSASRGFAVHAQSLTGDDVPFSSSRVRAAVQCGDVAEAAVILGRGHEVDGTVVTGDRRGRTLGFPTANVAVPAGRAVPADGVYATWVHHGAQRLPAATSVGTNPTFEGVTERRVESHVLDRDDLDLYGADLRVEFVERIRGMEAFSDVDALVRQMHDDVTRTRVVLGT